LKPQKRTPRKPQKKEEELAGTCGKTEEDNARRRQELEEIERERWRIDADTRRIEARWVEIKEAEKKLEEDKKGIEQERTYLEEIKKRIEDDAVNSKKNGRSHQGRGNICRTAGSTRRINKREQDIGEQEKKNIEDAAARKEQMEEIEKERWKIIDEQKRQRRSRQKYRKQKKGLKKKRQK